MKKLKFKVWDSDEGVMRTDCSISPDGVAIAPWGKEKPEWGILLLDELIEPDTDESNWRFVCWRGEGLGELK